MSILIKELHLPAERIYPLHLTIYSDGSVFCGHGIGKRTYEAVEVPTPHGRLIDADALEKEHMKRAYENFRSYQFHVTATAWINEAPTIIPGEREEIANEPPES